MPPAPRPVAIAVVGAGIGGLTAALALSQAGHAVTLVERRTGFSEVGAGVQLSPNASRILIDLGLGGALKRAASEPPGVAVHRLGSGRRIGGVALGALARERFGAPYYVIHRADLQTLLLDAVRARPNVRLLVGREVAGLGEGEAGVTLSLTTATGGAEAIEADALIGADGIRSRLRAHLDGAPLRPVRAAAWRAIVPREAVPDACAGDATGLWLGGGRHVVHYPIRGGRFFNVVAVVPERAGEAGWGRLGEPAVLRAHFRDAAVPLRALLALPDSWLVWSLAERAIARPMARGRTALLGDAAHPVLPFLAQGAALAIEDAAVLARCLADAPVPEALLAYAAARRRRAARVQRAARANGRTYHAGAGLSLLRDLAMARLGPDGMRERYAWLYGWTPP